MGDFKKWRKKMTIEPKIIRDLELKANKVIEQMYKYKRLFYKKQDEQSRITLKIADLKNKQENIFT